MNIQDGGHKLEIHMSHILAWRHDSQKIPMDRHMFLRTVKSMKLLFELVVPCCTPNIGVAFGSFCDILFELQLTAVIWIFVYVA